MHVSGSFLWGNNQHPCGGELSKLSRHGSTPCNLKPWNPFYVDASSTERTHDDDHPGHLESVPPDEVLQTRAVDNVPLHPTKAKRDILVACEVLTAYGACLALFLSLFATFLFLLLGGRGRERGGRGSIKGIAKTVCGGWKARWHRPPKRYAADTATTSMRTI